jgi:hypothetical protein
VWKSKFYGALVLNHRVVLHAIDATPARAPDALVDFHTGHDVRGFFGSGGGGGSSTTAGSGA